MPLARQEALRRYHRVAKTFNWDAREVHAEMDGVELRNAYITGGEKEAEARERQLKDKAPAPRAGGFKQPTSFRYSRTCGPSTVACSRLHSARRLL